MILVNRNFGNPILSNVIGDMFKSSILTNKPNFVNANGSNPAIGSESTILLGATYTTSSVDSPYNDSFFIVTDKFIKTLDKVYTKLWNESFTETGIYLYAKNLYAMFIGGNGLFYNTGPGTFKQFVDRCITAGILTEEDRLDVNDQIYLKMAKANMSVQVDTVNKLITVSNTAPIDIVDIDTRPGNYLNGKKFYLMFTPFVINMFVSSSAGIPYDNFKPKTDSSKFSGATLPMATHFFWSIGTPEDKEVALLEGKPVPDLIFDHLDRISHIDSLTLKIKFDKLQF